MGKEYKIKCTIPGNTEIDAMFRQLPSPIHRNPLAEIYNYKIEADGFYFVDRLVDTKTASLALRIAWRFLALPRWVSPVPEMRQRAGSCG